MLQLSSVHNGFFRRKTEIHSLHLGYSMVYSKHCFFIVNLKLTFSRVRASEGHSKTCLDSFAKRFFHNQNIEVQENSKEENLQSTYYNVYFAEMLSSKLSL